MQASMAPVYIGQVSQDLLVPVQSHGVNAWYQPGVPSTRSMLPRNTALFPDVNGAISYTDLWQPAASASPAVIMHDGSLHVSEQPCMQAASLDDRIYAPQYRAPVYTVPSLATNPRLYSFGNQVISSSSRPVASAAYVTAPMSSGQWTGAPVSMALSASQLRSNAAALAHTAAAKHVTLASLGNGYMSYAARDYPQSQSPASVSPAESSAWVSPPDSLLTMFKSNPNGMKLTLEDIIGHVVSFCKDQDGSKLLQKLLKPLIVQDNTSVSLQLVIAEMEPYVLKLMKHIYGRFVFIAFLGTWGSKYRSLVVDWMHGHFDELATDRYGYAVVKEALKNCDATLRLKIASELHPNIARIAEDVFGHDVVCVLTESIPTSDLEDSVNVLVETLNFQNQYSCSVAMALLDAMAFSDPRRACIITKMRLNAHVLAKSSRGILMLERLLDIGTAQEATDVAVMLIPNLVMEELTEHSCAVLLKSLERGGAIARSLFVAVVLQGGQLNVITHLMNQEYGKEVLQEVLQVLTGLERDALTAHIEKVSQLF